MQVIIFLRNTKSKNSFRLEGSEQTNENNFKWVLIVFEEDFTLQRWWRKSMVPNKKKCIQFLQVTHSQYFLGVTEYSILLYSVLWLFKMPVEWTHKREYQRGFWNPVSALNKGANGSLGYWWLSCNELLLPVPLLQGSLQYCIRVGLYKQKNTSEVVILHFQD